jgi:hypothetical protein
MDEAPDLKGDCWVDFGPNIPLAHKAYPGSPEGDRYQCHYGTCSARKPKPEPEADPQATTGELPF